MIYIKLEVKSGIYRVRMPMGRIGAIHFSILTKYMDNGQAELTLADKAALAEGTPVADKPMTPEMRSCITEAFLEWSGKVLPHILVGYTPVGTTEENLEIKVDDILGEDQFAIFMALLEQLEVGDTFFRIIK
jgi:hypothetical protein